MLQCPRIVVTACPLCGGKRHWKTSASIRVCQWRQWARDTGRISDPANIKDMGPASTTQLDGEFHRWLEQHPNLEAGSIPAERYIRQAARAQLTMQRQALGRPQRKPMSD